MPFTPLPIRTGVLMEPQDAGGPLQVSGWSDAALTLPAGATHFGIVATGEARLSHGPDRFLLRAGMFFVMPGACSISSAGGAGLVISRFEYGGLRQLGGPLEARGRLEYIDGCSDTLLVCPPKLGEPCLNHLHVPPHTRQTAHTHPSIRVGVILAGRGECVTPDGTFALRAGMGWSIPPGCLHAFVTAEDSLDVMAWHPDSDFGPTDRHHPMLNRTQLAFP